MSAKQIAREIVIDGPKGEVVIDGIAFPYYVDPNPEIEIPRDGVPIGIVRIGIIADSVIFIGENGKPETLVEASPAAHSAWARARGRELVLEGLADVLEWLDAPESRLIRNV